MPSELETALDPLCHNVNTIMAFYRREERKINRSQRSVEHLSGFFGRPVFLGLILAVVGLWVLVNQLLSTLHGHGHMLDPPPYFWLQGIVSLAGLLTSTVVLIKQNRMGKSDAQRAHLDLQVNLLTEQKVAKIINLIEELRRDLPNVKDRVDSEATGMQEPTDANAVLATIQQWNEADALAERRADSAEFDIAAIVRGN